MTRPSPIENRGLADRVHALCEEFVSLWRVTPEEAPDFGLPASRRRQISNARAAARLLTGIAQALEALPAGGEPTAEWRCALRQRVLRFGQERLGWPESYPHLLLGDAFYDSSVAFVRQARACAPHIPVEQLGQALRNVWVANSLQMLLDGPVRLGPALFGYSMLYPLTDNWLDDPAVPAAAKRRFNERLHARLEGGAVRAADAREAAVYRMVACIEAERPRDSFPAVYESLLAIQRGQTASLAQHDSAELAEERVLRLTMMKGGSSVLADLYVVAGTATPDEERFAFGYGVFLQLLDDLQDLREDLDAGHETLFTRAARHGTIDRPAARLARFIDAALGSSTRFHGPEFGGRLDLIQRNCRALLVGSLAESPRYVSAPFRARLAERWPVSLRAHAALRRRAAALPALLASKWSSRES